jgi:hypothetical protein
MARRRTPLIAAWLAAAFAVAAFPARAGSEPERGPSEPAAFRLPSGAILRTHGADPDFKAASLGATSSSVVCVPRSKPHFEAIVARARDDRERSLASVVDAYRQAILDASARMNGEAQSVGAREGARYRILCDHDQEIVVHKEVLPTPKDWDSFVSIALDLDAKGYHRPKTKYLVFYDDCASYSPAAETCFSGGIGSLRGDDRPTARNRNNRGGSFAVDFGGPGGDMPNWFVTLHESGHTMGAVQESAPHHSGAGHCFDGADVMCYVDGGFNDGAYNENSCPRPARTFVGISLLYPWDCGHDDYFDPAPSPGSYLATHWNIASPLNSFLDHG